ncbi:ribulose-phosphate 3-epimerase [Candidatus Woesearchaeota archaeon]|nr:ribulose-phosphate 3-epimerase [Candidatus Woesearchaeota archaeon]
MEKTVIPALIAKTQRELNQRINAVKDFAGLLQLDFMDSKFVPNSSLDFDLNLPELRYEAHLMVEDPKKYIDKYLDKIEIFLIHFESVSAPGEMINYVKGKGKKAGLVINPETTVEKIRPYLDEIGQVLVMTVNPGFYGSRFLPETLEKVKELRRMKQGINIEVDGGITDKTIKQAADAGANLLVSGSFIFRAGNPGKAFERLKRLI